jgi:hypothetical protein
LYGGRRQTQLPARTTISSTAGPATAAAPIAASSAATATIAAESGSALGLWSGLIYVHRPPIQIGAVKLGNRRFRISFLGHLYKCEASGLSAVPVRHNIHSLYVPVLRKSRHQIFLGCLETQIPDKDVRHLVTRSVLNMS